MEPRRIERALREGPPDEPVYVPGSFRRTRRGGAWMAFTTVAVGLALVAGIVVGVSLANLGGRHSGGSQPSPIAVADLLGTWRTDTITRSQWIEGATAAGFDSSVINAFLAHDPIQNQVRYTLEFFTSSTTGDRVTISAEYDGGSKQVLSGGTVAIDTNGVLHYTEVVPGTAAPRVSISALVTITNGQLSFVVLDVQNGSADDRLANTAFFELGTYTRVGP